jgi:hypothetical protein
VIVNIGKRAQREAERIDEQWRSAAEIRDLFAREFDEMLGELETNQGIGQRWPTEKRPALKRVMLPKTQVHLYFQRYVEEIGIVCVWWARRRRPPTL